MNAEVLNEIADWIELCPVHYHQAAYRRSLCRSELSRATESPRNCKTAYCIAGWAVWIDLGRKDEDMATIGSSNIAKMAIKVLDITEDESKTLFSEHWKPRQMSVPKALRAMARGCSLQKVTFFTCDAEEELPCSSM